jgi:hypothetical protein
LLKVTRSHKITNPSVATSLETGRPNACNLCHLDKTLAWAADAQQSWYGISAPKMSPDEREIAGSLLWLLRGHAGQRALIAWGMGWEPARAASGTSWMTPFLARMLEDPYEAIRFISDQSLRGLPGYGDAHTDHVAPESVRQLARWTAVENWGRENGSERTGSDVLIRSDGTLDEETMERLLGERDDRPVYRPE